MNIYDLAIQGPQNRASVLRSVQKMAPSASFTRFTGLFAYATIGGVDLMLDVLASTMKRWDSISKRWIISVDFARTEPEALWRLIALRNSEVRVPYFADVLRRNFKPVTCFHAKTIILEKPEKNNGPLGLIVSSANLTISGLSFGHENALFVMWKKAPHHNNSSPWGALIEELQHVEALIELSTPITPALIREYERKRPKKVIKSEDDSVQVERLTENHPEMSLNRAAALATSRHLWVEAGYIVENRGPGIPGNQIDLQRGTRVFFGFGVGRVSPNSKFGDVMMTYKNIATERNMRFGNNQMDKLDLPIPGVEGPPTYKNKTLLFSRQPDGSFILRIGSPREIREWKKLSRSQGTLYEMKGGRKYGVFE